MHLLSPSGDIPLYLASLLEGGGPAGPEGALNT
jgi:hypothetical protein